MRTLALLMLAALAGCGMPSDNDTNNHGYGYEYDVQGSSGLRLRYAPEFAAANPQWDIAFFEKRWSDVQACAEMSAPAPFVIIVPVGTLGKQPDGSNVRGRYFSSPSLIVIDENISWLDKHEETHYLLDYNTGDSSHNHDHPLFAPPELCSG